MSEIIKLRCYECENDECSVCPCGKWIDESSLEGCTRYVPELDADKFHHYMIEVVPFLHMNKEKDATSRTYSEIIDFLYNRIYNQPIGTKLGKTGKAVRL